MTSQVMKLTAQVRELQLQVFSIENLNGKTIQMYTGVPESSFAALVALVDRFELTYYHGTNVFKLSRANQL